MALLSQSSESSGGDGEAQTPDEKAIKKSLDEIGAKIKRLEPFKDDVDVAELLVKRRREKEDLLAQLRSQKPLSVRLAKAVRARGDQTKLVARLEEEEKTLQDQLAKKRDEATEGSSTLEKLRREAATLA